MSSKIAFLLVLFFSQLSFSYVGQSCTFDSDCASGRCHITQKICEARGGGLPFGWSCTFDSDCMSGKCNITRNICEGRGGGFPSGWECTFNSDCHSGYCNSQNQCR